SLAALSAAPLYSLALYLLFYAGNIVSRALGLGGDVERVYAMVEATVDRLALLGAISVAEELYWRGGIQESLVKSRLGRPWWLSAIPYSLAHVSSGITVLVPAALVAGLVLGLAAHRHGIATAIIAHYTWLILSFKIAPYQ
ncbi:MAG: CPBP family intramembrane metalloprotease, partial [Desulfurococcales archaeon]|nr:CPBP family intramembrane metalloprotease [Desulfurococcales archaeon]